MRLKRFGTVVCAFAIAALAAIAAAAHFLNPGTLLASLAATVKADTGRDLVFGDINVTLFPLPVIALSDVRFGNAKWGSQPWMAQAGRLNADVDLLALLSGRLHIARITVSGASVFLETDQHGRGNWALGSAKSGLPAWLDKLRVDELTLHAVALSYREGARGTSTSVQIDAAEFKARAPSDPIRLSLQASVDGKRMQATGTIGALVDLIDNAAYRVDLDGSAGIVRAKVTGTIARPHDLGQLELAVRLQAEEFAELAALFGANSPALGPMSAQGRLTGTAAAPEFSAIAVDIGTPDRIALKARGGINGSATAGSGYVWETGGIDLVVHGAQLSDLGALIGKPLPALGRFLATARVSGPLDAPALSLVDIAVGERETLALKLKGSIAHPRALSGLDLQVEASSSRWWRTAPANHEAPLLPPFRAHARMRDAPSGYRLDDLDLSVGESRVHASLQVARSGGRLNISGKAAAPLVDLARPASGKPTARASPAAGAAPAPSPLWKLADLDVDLSIERLVLPNGRPLRSASGRLKLDDGRLRAQAVKATLGGANVEIDGEIDDPQNLTGIDLRIAMQGHEFAELSEFFGMQIGRVGPYHGRARLHGSRNALGVADLDTALGPLGQRLHVRGQIGDVIRGQDMALAISADVADPAAAGRLIGLDLPAWPAFRGTARVSGPRDGYALDDLDIALGRTSVQGRVLFSPGTPRPRVSAHISGPRLDLSELQLGQIQLAANSSLPGVDVDATVDIERVVLADRHVLGPVRGSARLGPDGLELKHVSVAVDGASLTADGSVKDPLTASGLDLSFVARVTDGSGFAALVGQPLPSFSASGRLTDMAQGYMLTRMKLESATTTLSAEVALIRSARGFKVSAKAHAPLLDLSSSAKPAAEPSAGDSKTAARRAIPALPLPLDLLRSVEGDLELRADAVQTSAASALGRLQVRATVADERLEVEAASLDVEPGQTLNLSGTIDAKTMAWEFLLGGERIELGAMLERFGRPVVVTGGRTDLSLRLRGRGNSLRDVLGSLEGDARVKVGPHRIHGFAVNPDTSIFKRVLDLASPSSRTDPDTEVQCIAVRLPVKDGVIVSERNIAAETTKYNAVVSGTVDLRSETIAAFVMPVAKGGSGLGEVTAVVRLGGTLAAPSIDVDAVGIATRSALSLGATVGTLGTSWLAGTVLKKTIEDPHPCATALAP